MHLISLNICLCVRFTTTKAFMNILRELHDMASQHEIIAENTQTLIIKEIQQLIIELKQERKKVGIIKVCL